MIDEDIGLSHFTFLLGECITGAGGDGGPLGIFLFTLMTEKKYNSYI